MKIMLRNGYVLRNDDLLMGYSRPPDICPLCGVTDDKNDWDREDLGKWKCKICGQISEVEVIPDNDFIRKMDSIRKLEHELSFRKDEIHRHINEVLEKWHRITGRKDRDELQWDKWKIEEMDGELFLTFDWSVSWRYGGHDDGRFSVPFKYFYDEESLLQLEDEQRTKKELEDAETKRRMRERRRMQYEKLKKEFEDDGHKGDEDGM